MRERPRTKVVVARRDDGFTLIEVLIAVALSSIIAGVVLAALVTSLNASSSTAGQVSDSTDAGLISSYIFRDAQSAGAVDPATATINPLLGVSTSNSTAGWSGCAQTSPLVVRFSWVDYLSATSPTTVVVTYSLDDQHQLIRRLCRNGTVTELTIGRNVASVSVTCMPDPTCVAPSTSVAMSVAGANDRAPFAYTLTAALRMETQTPPTASNSASVPLIALETNAEPLPCSTVVLSGTGAISVIGNVLVTSTCEPTAVSGDLTRLQPTGTTSIQDAVTDPMVGRQPPAGSCGSGTTNPVVGASSGPTSSTVYPQPVSIFGPVDFSAGQHIFCAGLALGPGSQVAGSGVLLYVAGGTLAIDRLATLDLSSATAGPYAGLLAWVATPQTVSLNAGPKASTLRGVLYAPTSSVSLSSEVGFNIGGLIVDSLDVTGSGPVRIGQPIPHIALSPRLLPPAEVGVGYAVGLTSTGGTSPSTWSIAGLPPGLSIASTTGLVTGNPTASGTFQVVATTVDATAAAASIEYTLSVAPALLISAPATLPNGVVGIPYPGSVIVAAGGATPFVWSATGLPAGLQLDATTGAIGGTPTQSGVFALTVNVADARGGISTRSFGLTIVPPLAITATSPPASGQVGSAFTATTTATAGGFAPYTWSASGLPGGLTIDPATGVISGTPSASGTFAIAVVVTDSTTASSSVVVTITIDPLVANPAGCPTAPAGWTGEYFSNRNLAGKAKLCRDDAAIDFNWGNGGPGTGLPDDHFSVRWTRTQTFAAGNYTFSIGSDDGSRLYVDGIVVFDRWVDQGYPATVPTAVVPLTAGSHTIVLEYYERSGLARALLTWS